MSFSILVCGSASASLCTPDMSLPSLVSLLLSKLPNKALEVRWATSVNGC